MNKNFFVTVMVTFIYASSVFGLVPMPSPPTYTSCAVIQVPDVGTNPEDGTPLTTTHSEVDPACITRLNQEYDAQRRANAMANNLVMDDKGNFVAPKAPEYQTCDTTGEMPDYNCMNANANKERQYNQDMNIHNTVLKAQEDAKNQQKTNLEVRQTGSTTDSLATAQAKANESKSEQNGLNTAFTMTSIGFGVAYAGTCAMAGACQQPLLYLSIAAAVMAGLSAKQANQDANTANQACESNNRISSNPQPCGTGEPPVDPTKPFPYDGTVSSAGVCLPTAPPTCQKNLEELTNKGVDIKTAMKNGYSNFAGANTPYKVNKDGSVTGKNGKTYTAADFANVDSMIAAGISPADANALSNQLYGKNGIIAKAGLDAKSDLNALSKGGSFEGGGGTSTVGVGGEASDKSGLGSKDPNARKPAAADGLIRDFNGDAIGIANDDIFKMMNKRYILKSSQDSFIGQ